MSGEPPVHVVGCAVLAPLQSLPPRPAQSYLVVARGAIRGAQLLAAEDGCPPVALALLCCHGLECILKGFLADRINPGNLKAAALRHDLAALWALSVNHGLAVPTPEPSWLALLSDMHKAPYHLRYAQGLNGMVFPPLRGLPDELHALLELVGQR